MDESTCLHTYCHNDSAILIAKMHGFLNTFPILCHMTMLGFDFRENMLQITWRSNEMCQRWCAYFPLLGLLSGEGRCVESIPRVNFRQEQHGSFQSSINCAQPILVLGMVLCESNFETSRSIVQVPINDLL